jgi:hypothetical protein
LFFSALSDACLSIAGMDTFQRIPAYVLKDLVRQLNPRRFPGMPPAMAALTGFVLGAEFQTAWITAVEITGSGTVLAQVDGDATERRVLGRYSDLLRSWRSLVSRAGLIPLEFIEVQCLFAKKVGFPGPPNA